MLDGARCSVGCDATETSMCGILLGVTAADGGVTGGMENREMVYFYSFSLSSEKYL